MFNNVGEKIKIFSKVAFWILAVLTFLAGIIVLADAYYEDEIIIGISLLIGGPISAWVTSLFVYGFGELIYETTNIKKSLSNLGRNIASGSNNMFSNDTSTDMNLISSEAIPPLGTDNLSYTKSGKVCNNCGTDLPEDSKFCTKCGTPILSESNKQSICPSCGKPISEKSAFCTKCGYKVDQSKE